MLNIADSWFKTSKTNEMMNYWKNMIIFKDAVRNRKNVTLHLVYMFTQILSFSSKQNDWLVECWENAKGGHFRFETEFINKWQHSCFKRSTEETGWGVVARQAVLSTPSRTLGGEPPPAHEQCGDGEKTRRFPDSPREPHAIISDPLRRRWSPPRWVFPAELVLLSPWGAAAPRCFPLHQTRTRSHAPLKSRKTQTHSRYLLLIV